jgi:hypothetical protein
MFYRYKLERTFVASIWIVSTLYLFNFKCSLVFLFMCIPSNETELFLEYFIWSNCRSTSTIHRNICIDWGPLWCTNFATVFVHFFMAISTFLWNFIWKQRWLQKCWVCNDIRWRSYRSLKSLQINAKL